MPGCHDFVLNHERDELLAIHQRNRDRVRTGGFFSCAFAEIAGGDDESLFVCNEAAPDLLNVRGLHVLLAPLLYLHGHLRADDLADDRHALDVDPAILEWRRDGQFIEPNFRKKFRGEMLELSRGHSDEPLEKFRAYLPVVLLNVEGESLAHPDAEAG